MRVPGTAAASVQRLTAPSPSAKTGETLNGQTLTSAGTWRGRATHELLAPGPGGYAVRMPAASAALLFVVACAAARGGAQRGLKVGPRDRPDARGASPRPARSV